jgi:hypothetical protein
VLDESPGALGVYGHRVSRNLKCGTFELKAKDSLAT